MLDLLEPEFNEIRQPVLLCTPNGDLNPLAAGWSRHPTITSNLRGHYLRKKRWNYWCVTNNKFMFSITISDIDYAGLVFVYYLNFETGEFAEDTITLPFASGVRMGEEVNDTACYNNDKKAKVLFTYHGNSIVLDTFWRSLKGKSLRSEIEITIPQSHETLNVVVPWSRNLFQYTSKQHCLPAKGYFQIGTERYVFNEDDSFACHDFGRGVWPYSIEWNWGAFSARCGNQTVGFNSGDRWTNGTGITENSVCIDGILYKISEPVKWHYNRNNFKDVWQIFTTESNNVNLIFTPFYERTAKENLLLVKSEVHQCFGRYSGTIKAGEQVLGIVGAIGWAEEHIAKW